MSDPSFPSAPTPAPAETTAARSADAALLETALMEMKKVIVGQDRAIERLFVGLLARGHVLLEGVPGLAKTLAVETLATLIGGNYNRLQFTPDLLPADLIGTRIFRSSNETFDIEWGPVFANIVLADEINRAPAKVQSALLEVMAEHQVSIAGVTKKVPEPFLVLATQNPIESEGVYPLPEAQRDRFLMKVVVGYPTAAEEAQIVARMGVGAPKAQQVLSLEQLVDLQTACDAVHVAPAVADYAVRIFTPKSELPFAGHPTLGTAHAVIEAGLATPKDGKVVQQCAVGLVQVSQSGSGLSFRLPRYAYEEDRTTLTDWAVKKGPEGVDEYIAKNNQKSIDGLPGLPAA